MSKQLAKALAERGLPSDNDSVSLKDERGAESEDDDDPEPFDLIWGVAGIAKVIKRTPRATHYLLETNQLEGCAKVGGRWCGSYKRLRQHFAALLGVNDARLQRNAPRIRASKSERLVAGDHEAPPQHAHRSGGDADQAPDAEA